MMSKLEEKIDYTFEDKLLLKQALTHKSFVKDGEIQRHMCNERLEFIGDAFLDAIIGEELFFRLPCEKEGNLSKKRAEIVCEKSLATVGKAMNIGEHILLSRGEKIAGGQFKESIVADAVEAIIGAIYIEAGYNKTKECVLRLFDSLVVDSLAGKLYSDYKTKFQEKAQEEGVSVIEYKTVRSEGPDHAKTFYVEVFLNGVKCGEGQGKTKKEAEQKAAKEAISRS